MTQIIVLNLTTESYFIGNSVEDCAKILRDLITPLNKDTALLEEDVGESHWKRGDKIIYVPPHLYVYTQKKYNQLYV